MFDMLVWGGAALTLVGLAALIWCIVTAIRIRRAELDENMLRARMQGILAVNMVALVISALGLMTVVLGVMLG
ncbi:hypothetical protein C9E81_07540 [Paracoccus alkanivorans]|uniref:Uncharacterized protein n=1 Tax=Paracoccus alkanivorans TaxID=2116655 RepID=A0A3M0MLZ1_9RHOB|nr:hypothetical protein [Paracoccus alkanivorans]RMC36700.1 hypothetical protein C9E81_07540 [Paracoccus alkanivorans]